MLILMQSLGRCYGVTQNKAEDIIRKTVPFGPTEQELYNYAMDQCDLEGLKFATYVKKLIKQSKEQPLTNEPNFEKILDQYFKDKDITISDKEKAIDNVSFTKNDKSALLNFMKK